MITLDTLKAKAASRLAVSHVAGPELEDAVPVLRMARRRGWKVTVSPWKRPGQKPSDLLEEYKKALTTLSGEVTLSVKPADLGYDAARLAELAEIGAAHRMGIHLDAQDPEGADRSFTLLERLRQSFDHIGCTLPARWRRSIDDARRAIELGVAVRVVKGQWPGRSGDDNDCRKRFMALVSILADKSSCVGVATHDVPLATRSLIILKGSKTACELEQMLALPHGAVRFAETLEIPVRLYIPYGHPYLPYRISDCLRRPAIAAWLMSDLLGRKKWTFNSV